MDHAAAEEIARFWKSAGPARWFDKDADFDRQFRDAFLSSHLAAARRELDHWQSKADGSLALLILVDQFPRNAFRGSAHMYATDPLARHFARRAHEAAQMRQVEPELRVFFCLPFAHSEAMADQDRSLELHLELGEPWLSHARDHREIIRRFGRFPHRNAVLGRETTPQEQAFLDGGGFAG